jgi:hypothetical protein
MIYFIPKRRLKNKVWTHLQQGAYLQIADSDHSLLFWQQEIAEMLKAFLCSHKDLGLLQALKNPTPVTY